MGLSEQGCAAWYFWNQIPNHFKNVRLDAFVVMPNHIHGIIQILPDENGFNPVALCNCIMPQEKIREFGKPKAGSLSVILNNYKGSVTRWCNRKGYEFCWQSRFHDHIIRNYRSLNRIRQYIECNPLNWEKDSKNVL
ncbi:transposase [Gracilimonas sediminicola]|uniref:transposase n=2 Tax=Gracilimonas TaxID=649462 RepID=UPI0038D50EC5